VICPAGESVFELRLPSGPESLARQLLLSEPRWQATLAALLAEVSKVLPGEHLIDVLTRDDEPPAGRL
jgi:hypothetical protein